MTVGRVIALSATAVLFPGHDSRVAEMREEVADARPDLLDRASELTGDDPFARAGESSRFAAAAIFCASLASWSRVADQVEPVLMAGHSLGEISALAAAGAVSEDDALRLVVTRGQLLDDGPATGAMLAVVGGTPARGASLAARHGVTLAYDDAPDHVVLSGDRDALMGAANDARSQGLRAALIDGASAFNSTAMTPAIEPFARACAAVRWSAPAVPVVSCASVAPFQDPAAELPAALAQPVRWRETVQMLAVHGVDTFVDIGPGRGLAELASRSVASAAIASATTLLLPH